MSTPSSSPKYLAEREGKVIELSQHDLERLKFRVNGRCNVRAVQPGQLVKEAS